MHPGRGVVAVVLALGALGSCADDNEAEGGTTTSGALAAETVPGGSVTIVVGGDATAAAPSPGPTTTVDPAELACPATDSGNTDPTGDADALVKAACATEAAAQKRFAVSSTTGAGNVSFGARGVVDLDAARADVTLTRQGVDSIRYIVDGDRVWFTSGLTSFTAIMPEGRVWVSASLAEAQGVGVLDTNPAGPPVGLIVLGASDVQVDGERHQFTVSADALTVAVPVARRAAVSQLLPIDQPDLEITGDAFVTDGRLTDVTITAVASSTGAATVWTASYSDYDVPVDIAPPPAEQAVSFADVPDLPNAMAALTGA